MLTTNQAALMLREAVGRGKIRVLIRNVEIELQPQI